MTFDGPIFAGVTLCTHANLLQSGADPGQTLQV